MNKWSKKFKRCINCGNTKFSYKGNGYCKICYDKVYEKRHIAECSICKRIKVIATRNGDKVICKPCYKKLFYKEKKIKCSICSEVGKIGRHNNGKLICKKCNEKYFYDRPKSRCFKCGKIGIRSGYRNGMPICIRCYSKEYKKLNKDTYRALKHIRKARIRGSGGNLIALEISMINNRDQRCVYCGSKSNLTLDHIVPLSKGGMSTFNNYVLACQKCNISKGKKDVFEWCKERKIAAPKVIRVLLNK